MLRIENKKGFTLVEILIVILILGLLSTLAVGGYTEYRANTLFGLAVDDLGSRIFEMRSKAINGTGPVNNTNLQHIKGVLKNDADVVALAESSPKCYGVLFEKTSEGLFIAKFFEQEFVNQRVWREGKWNYQGCGNNYPGAGEIREELAVDGLFGIESLEVNDVFVADKMMVRFLPPNGAFELKDDNDQNFVTTEDLPRLKMVVRYGGGDEPKRKIVDFDLQKAAYSSGNLENVNP